MEKKYQHFGSCRKFIGFNLKSEVDNNGNLYIGTVAASPSGFVLIKLNPNGTTLFTKSNNFNGLNGFKFHAAERE